jgi:hypothetical protein
MLRRLTIMALMLAALAGCNDVIGGGSSDPNATQNARIASPGELDCVLLTDGYCTPNEVQAFNKYRGNWTKFSTTPQVQGLYQQARTSAEVFWAGLVACRVADKAAFLEAMAAPGVGYPTFSAEQLDLVWAGARAALCLRK